MLPISPSLTDFEAGLLLGLWQASLLLAALSVVVAFTLIARRYYEAWRDGKRALRRAQLDRVFWGALEAPVPLTPESLPPLDAGDIMMVCDQALNMLRPLRGEDAARIVRLLELWPVREYIKRKLAKGRRGERIRMLTLLAHFEDAESLELLKKEIGAADFYVQLAALRSLAARNAIEVLPQILKELEHAKRQNTSMLADVLRRFDEPAIEMLIQLAIGAAQPEVRLAAIRAMDAIGSLQTAPALLSLAADPLVDIRAEAIAALGHLGDPGAEQAVLHALGDKEEAVRVRAARAAGRLHLRTAAPLLAAMLSDASWWVRYRAAEALYQMGSIGQSFLQTRSKEADRAAQTAAQLLAEKEAA